MEPNERTGDTNAQKTWDALMDALFYRAPEPDEEEDED